MAIGLRGLDPVVRERAQIAMDIAAYYGVPVTLTSTYRPWEQQERLYRVYLDCRARGEVGQPGPCKYPANRPGDSAHNFGWAWDSVVPEQYQDWWDAVRRWVGFEVLPNDRIHAQVPNWRQYRAS